MRADVEDDFAVRRLECVRRVEDVARVDGTPDDVVAFAFARQ
jgi:hypothetical protein